MKRKAIYVTFFIAILSLIAIVPITSAFATTGTNKTISKDQTKPEKGKIIIKYTAPETDWDSATPKEKEDLKEIGWELEDEVLVQYRSVPEEIDKAIKDGYHPPENNMMKSTEPENHDGKNKENTKIGKSKKTERNEDR